MMLSMSRRTTGGATKMVGNAIWGLMLLYLAEGFSVNKVQEPTEVTQDNIEFKLKEKKCLILYASQKDCEKCKLLYNKFLTVSQTFANERDVSFGYFTDRALLDAFDVDATPAIIYYEFGSASPKLYRGDITTGALTKIVTMATKADMRHVVTHYAVQLTRLNFEAVVGLERQYRLVMLHLEDQDRDIEIFDTLAKAYDNDVQVVLARINVDREKYLDNRYIADTYPSFYWYPTGTVDKKKRYGGKLRIDQLNAFINEQAGLHRMSNGRLSPFAGLIKPIDNVLIKHGKDLYKLHHLDTIVADVKSTISSLPGTVDRDLADYYLHLLAELEEDQTIESLTESRNRLFRAMEDTGPHGRDQLFRKLNIVKRVIDIIGKQLLQDVSEGELDISEDVYGIPNRTRVEFHDEF